MTCEELIKYLSGFEPSEQMAVVPVNLQTREAYKISGYQLITDAGFPALLFELGQAEPLDDVVEDAENG